MSLNKVERRARIKLRIRKIVSGTAQKPRMSVFRSNRHISVQLIDDLNGVTLAAASSRDKEVAEKVAGLNKVQVAALVGKLAAERSVQKGITEVSFDRNGYLYHGSSRITGLKYNKLTIRASRTKWGSCTGTNNISLSLFLMTLPEHLRDFVIVHELCHTVHHDHSPKFHALVDRLVGGNEKALNRELKAFSIRG